MPKSKRQKIVSLTQVKAKRKELKVALVDHIRDNVDKYTHAFVFTFENMRTSPFKDLRGAMAVDSRFFLGKNRVMQKALGSGQDEFRPHLGKLAADVRGNVGLLFTNRSRAEVEATFAEHEQPDFARAGCVAGSAVSVPRGVLALPHTMVDELKKLGMANLKLDKGVPTLPIEHAICAAGDVLTPEQCRLLKHFGHQLAVFQLALVSMWSDGKYELLDADRLQAAAAGAAAGAEEEDVPAGAKRKSTKKAAAATAADDDDEDDEDGGDDDDEDMT